MNVLRGTIWRASRVLQRCYSTAALRVQNQNYYFHQNWLSENKAEFTESFIVHDDFVTETEEESLMSELEPHLKRHIYEKDHWDDVSLRENS